MGVITVEYLENPMMQLIHQKDYAVRIAYHLNEPARVRLCIHHISGQCVRVLAEGRQSPGSYSILWNGCDEENNPVASGIYFCLLRQNQLTRTQMILFPPRTPVY